MSASHHETTCSRTAVRRVKTLQRPLCAPLYAARAGPPPGRLYLDLPLVEAEPSTCRRRRVIRRRTCCSRVGPRSLRTRPSRPRSARKASPPEPRRRTLRRPRLKIRLDRSRACCRSFPSLRRSGARYGSKSRTPCSTATARCSHSLRRSFRVSSPEGGPKLSSLSPLARTRPAFARPRRSVSKEKAERVRQIRRRQISIEEDRKRLPPQPPRTPKRPATLDLSRPPSRHRASSKIRTKTTIRSTRPLSNAVSGSTKSPQRVSRTSCATSTRDSNAPSTGATSKTCAAWA
jgi:hypothetical protein